MVVGGLNCVRVTLGLSLLLVNLLPLHLLAVSKSEETVIFGSCFYRYMSVSPVTHNQLIFLDFFSLKVRTNLVCAHKSFALKE